MEYGSTKYIEKSSFYPAALKGSGRVVLIDDGRVYQSKAADTLVQVKTTTFGTNVGLNMLLNISSRYFGGLFWSRQLRCLPSSDGYFLL